MIVEISKEIARIKQIALNYKEILQLDPGFQDRYLDAHVEITNRFLEIEDNIVDNAILEKSKVMDNEKE